MVTTVPFRGLHVFAKGATAAPAGSALLVPLEDGDERERLWLYLTPEMRQRLAVAADACQRPCCAGEVATPTGAYEASRP